MPNITETATWDANINAIQTTDPLLGGPDTAPLNLAVKQLADRTQWLKLGLQGYAGVIPINSNHTLVVTETLYNLILIDANGAALNILLPDSTTLAAGSKVKLVTKNVNTAQVKIQCFNTGTENINNGSIPKPAIYMGDGDVVELVWTASGWFLSDTKGNFDDVGGIIYRYAPIPNTLTAQGQLVSRAAYPRLWEWVQTLGSSLIDDILWSVEAYRGFFSTGNNATTFRIPDLRAMFIRGLDLGAGIDLSRATNGPGGYELDQLKSHTHTTNTNPTVAGSHWPFKDGPGYNPTVENTSATGGLETVPKNIALLPLIKI